MAPGKFKEPNTNLPTPTFEQSVAIADAQIDTAIFNNIGRDQINHTHNNTYHNIYSQSAPKNIQEVLAEIKFCYCHDAHTRFPYPKCSEGTREGVLEEVLKWIESNPSQDSSRGVYWLRGSAGVGKSAIAQTVAEKCDKKDLITTFFFSRTDPNRNHPQYLALAIAYGITMAIPSLRDSIIKLVADTSQLLWAPLETQFRVLVVEPLLCWEGRHAPPKLIIIDGLDECPSTDDQKQVLALVLLAMTKKLPLRFLICSRPESQIRERFSQTDLRQFTRSTSLDENLNVNRHDIEVMLRNEFNKIRQQFSHLVFPDPWPGKDDIEMLVDKCSGKFSYATLVVRFIGARNSHPCDQLRTILGMTSDEISSGSNIAISPTPTRFGIGALYHGILTSATEDYPKLVQIIASVLLLKQVKAATPKIIELLLGLRQGDVSRTLQKIDSILQINGIDNEINVYHDSFVNFLYDQSQSGVFFIDADYHHQELACRWLSLLDDPSVYNACITRTDAALEAIWWKWGTFCAGIVQPNERLFDALKALDLQHIFTKLVRANWTIELQLIIFPETQLHKKFSHFKKMLLWLQAIQHVPEDIPKDIQSFEIAVNFKNGQFDSGYANHFIWRMFQIFCFEHVDVRSNETLSHNTLGEVIQSMGSALSGPSPMDIIDLENVHCVCRQLVPKGSAAFRCTRNPSMFHVYFQRVIDTFLPRTLTCKTHLFLGWRIILSVVNIVYVLPWCSPDPMLLQCCSILTSSVFAACQKPGNDPKAIAETVVKWMKKFPPPFSQEVQPYISQLTPYLDGLEDWKDAKYVHNSREAKEFRELPVFLNAEKKVI